MSGWASGYVTEVNYTHDWHQELLPHSLAFAALTMGFAVRGLPGEPIRVLELGCGQGVSANLIAAGNPHVEYVGVDFNPAHIVGASQLANEADLPNVRFLESSFEEVAKDETLGQFDVVTLHGIYTWVSAENREHIVEIARDKLKNGGLLYVSYNCFPGWGSILPIRRLFTDAAEANPKAPIFDRLDEGFRLFDELKKLNAPYIVKTAGLVERMDKFRNLQKNYLAHEYLNGEWTIFHSPDVAADMARAKLSYVGSAHLLDNVEAVNFTKEQIEFIAAIKDPPRREWFKDLIGYQNFRRDIFVKGASRLGPISIQEKWNELRFVLSCPAADVPRKVKGLLGEVDLLAQNYDPIIARLEGAPKSLRELLADPAIAALGWPRVFQALVILIGQGHCHLALPAALEADRGKRTDALNGAIIRRARESGELAHLVSPVTGSGFAANRLAQLYLLASRQNNSDRARFIWEFLKASGQKFSVAGKILESDEENLAELKTNIEKIEKDQAKIFASLKIR